MVAHRDRWIPFVGLSPTERKSAALDAAEKLAREIEAALDGDDLAFPTVIRKEANRSMDITPLRPLTHLANLPVVLVAFSRFIERERSLPTKTQLNIEAHRIFKSEGPHHGHREFGEIVSIGENRVDSHRVYASFIDFVEGDRGETVEVFMHTRVPYLEWDKPHWPDRSGLSPTLKALGMNGLRQG